MSEDTTNFSFTLPSASDSGWAGTLNDGIQEIDTLLAVSLDSDGTLKAGAVDATAVIGDGIITPAKHATRARAFLVQAVSGYNNTDSASMERGDPTGWTMLDEKSYTLVGNFYVPPDFSSSMTISAVLYSEGTGNVYGYNLAYHGAAGEAFNTHSQTSGVTTAAVTANQVGAKYTLTMSNMAAEDYAFLQYNRNGAHASDTASATVYFVGWLVSYTADS